MTKVYAPESPKTQRAREKLSKTFEKQNQQITPKALQTTLEKIRKWIADNNDKRVQIKNKPIELFAGNRDFADTSKKVKELARLLQDSTIL